MKLFRRVFLLRKCCTHKGARLSFREYHFRKHRLIKLNNRDSHLHEIQDFFFQNLKNILSQFLFAIIDLRGKGREPHRPGQKIGSGKRCLSLFFRKATKAPHLFPYQTLFPSDFPGTDCIFNADCRYIQRVQNLLKSLLIFHIREHIRHTHHGRSLQFFRNEGNIIIPIQLSTRDEVDAVSFLHLHYEFGFLIKKRLVLFRSKFSVLQKPLRL